MGRKPGALQSDTPYAWLWRNDLSPVGLNRRDEGSLAFMYRHVTYGPVTVFVSPAEEATVKPLYPLVMERLQDWLDARATEKGSND